MFPFPFYDARGNTYFVATPDEIRTFVALPESAAAAATSYKSWTETVVQHVCADPRHANGLLVGPFTSADGCGLLIVNTDGSLAEFSGNGLTIFSQFLVDTGRKDRSRTFVVQVHHDRSNPIRVPIEPGEQDGTEGFWVDMGIPTFGPEMVEASLAFIGISELNGRKVSRVFALEQIDADWTSSQFVNVGNPHCVTFLKTLDSLVSMDKRESVLAAELTRIAYSSVSGAARGAGQPCRNGVNLQWAFVAGPDEIKARVFERGEGWTRSSGSSATAVASAARHLGLITATTVRVAMPGGAAPVRFAQSNDRVERVRLFGEAQLSSRWA
jgi:diaminopimelate epimerase